MNGRDPAERFGDRVEDYLRSRPGYPPELVAHLRARCGLRPGCAAADVGSGTGKLTELLLAAGSRVYAVEPNAGMRAAAERLLGRSPGFVSVDGRAEATGLPEASVDLVTAAQAFHWFDVAGSRAEFLRILRPPGVVALVWNDRHEGESAFLRGWEDCLRRFSVDYAEVDHRDAAARERIEAFFGPAGFSVAEFPNHQDLDLAGLQARYRSCSYALPRGHPRFAEAMSALAALFAAHQRDGLVRLDYRTRVYHGKPS